uniref:Uncharacterized protein n=1 Tax=Arundo donax TaxID=35708 RepID=A0A0A9E5V0_ARUDO
MVCYPLNSKWKVDLLH